MPLITDILFPDLTGSSYFTAKKFLEHHGFSNVRLKYSESNLERNTILHQNIEPGTETDPDDEVVLTLAAKNPVKNLPSMYQSMDNRNGGFLTRYLWIVHSLLNSINVTLDNIHLYFNPMESPKDFFPWLVSWFSDYYRYAIPEETLRIVIKNIVPLYRWRGTAAGIARLLEIIIGVRPEIMDNYRPVGEYIIRDNAVVENIILQEETTDSFFTVAFPVSVSALTATQVQLINDILKREKPAHTVYYLTFEKEGVSRPRDYAIIGVDNII